MGLRPMEFRLSVVRRALSRSIQPLVLMHLRSPSDESTRLLAQVLAGAYRVMDPRRRGDLQHRVMLGRIHPQLIDEAVDIAQSRVAMLAPEADIPGGEAAGPATAAPLAAWSAELSGESGAAGERTFSSADEWPGYEATLASSDLLVIPGHVRLWRALRRRAVAASVPSRVAATLLAASLLLVATWRTTSWVRSWGRQDRAVAVAIEAPGQLSRRAEQRPGGSAAEPGPAEPGPEVGRTGAGTQQRGSDPDEMSGEKGGGSQAIQGGATSGDSGAPGEAEPPEESPAVREYVDVEVLSSEEDLLADATDAVIVMRSSQAASDAMAMALRLWETTVELADRWADAGAEGEAELTDQAAMGLSESVDEPADEPGGAAAATLPSVPEPSQWESARLRVERLADERAGSAGASVVTYRELAIEMPDGSPRRWVAWLLAGRASILAGETAQSGLAVRSLADQFDIDLAAATLQLATWVSQEVTREAETERLVDWLDTKLRWCMVRGDLELAEQLRRVLADIGVRRRDDVSQSAARRWRDVLTLATRDAEVFGRKRRSAQEELAPEDHDSLGRYWALVRRDWHRGLPHLASGTNTKLARLVGIELLSGTSLDAADALRVADGYLSEARRGKGWLGESYAWRAHELLTAAVSQASAAEARQLRRRAEEVRDRYGEAFEPLADDGLGGLPVGADRIRVAGPGR